MNRMSMKAVLGGSLMALASATALAATDTLLVTGTVLAVTTISFSAFTGASFNITPGTAIVAANIATVNVNSNDALGYDITLAGTHGSSVLQDGGSNTIAYTVAYNGGGALNMTTTPVNVETPSSPTAGSVTRTLTLDIAGGASGGKPAGAYTDTITATITGK
jgi:hypothetical protein